MRESADPRYGTLETETEAGMNEGSILPEVEIPAVRLLRQSFFADPVKQLVVVVLAL
jgi:hypothetical protein